MRESDNIIFIYNDIYQLTSKIHNHINIHIHILIHILILIGIIYLFFNIIIHELYLFRISFSVYVSAYQNLGYQVYQIIILDCYSKSSMVCIFIN